jgi:DNA-binding NtrC family response regulator
MFRKTILIVDDEPIVTTTLVLIVNRFHEEFLAIGSNSVAEALTLDGEIHPDLVVLDVFMPDARGLRHANEMRDKYGCEILLMSGHGDAGTLVEEENRNNHVRPFEIIAKPIQPGELVKILREKFVRPNAHA